MPLSPRLPNFATANPPNHSQKRNPPRLFCVKRYRLHVGTCLWHVGGGGRGRSGFTHQNGHRCIPGEDDLHSPTNSFVGGKGLSRRHIPEGDEYCLSPKGRVSFEIRNETTPAHREYSSPSGMSLKIKSLSPRMNSWGCEIHPLRGWGAR